MVTLGNLCEYVGVCVYIYIYIYKCLSCISVLVVYRHSTSVEDLRMFMCYQTSVSFWERRIDVVLEHLSAVVVFIVRYGKLLASAGFSVPTCVCVSSKHMEDKLT